jgi:lipid-A-disaccharide synthase
MISSRDQVPRWAISSFEVSGDQIAERFLQSCDLAVNWIGYQGRSYTHRLSHAAPLPSWASVLYGQIGILGVLLRSWVYLWLCRYLVRHFFNLHVSGLPISGLVVVDFGSFHMRLVNRLHKKIPDLKVIYVAPPKVWATRPGRVQWLQAHVNHLVVLYPHEWRYLKAYGLPVEWVRSLGETPASRPEGTEGSPLGTCLSQLLSTQWPSQLLIYPGSRESEIFRILNLSRRVLRDLRRKNQGPDSVCISLPKALWHQKSRYAHILKGVEVRWMCEEVCPLNSRTVAWVCSGTMTLKVFEQGVPMVIVYGMDRFSHWMLRRVMGYLGFLGLPNLVLNQPVVPELVGPSLTPSSLSRWTQELLGSLSTYQGAVYEIQSSAARWLELKQKALEWSQIWQGPLRSLVQSDSLGAA